MNITDLVAAVKNDNPTDFRSAFDAVIHDRVVDAVAAKKIEVARSFGVETAVEEIANTDEGTTDGQDTEAAA